MAFRDDGTPTTSSVEDVIRYDVNEYFKVTTDRMVTLRVTKEHPFFIGKGTFKTLAALKVGDSVFGYDGRGWSEQKILSIERSPSTRRFLTWSPKSPTPSSPTGLRFTTKGAWRQEPQYQRLPAPSQSKNFRRATQSGASSEPASIRPV